MLEETIAAISTPAGEGGIGIIRISGPLAETIGLKCLRQPNSSVWKSFELRRVYFGVMVDAHEQRIDEAVFFLFRAPKSYTREDMLEIQIHGNKLLLEAALRRVIECGARLAEPGEFTKRAFTNGRIDLTQVEALVDLIRARTERSGKIATQLLAGGLSGKVRAISRYLTECLAELEATLDYPEDDIQAAEVTERLLTVTGIKQDIQALISQSSAGKMLREGVNIVLVGRPNVGKSSLMNAFLREERAIVTDIPGTTRDVIIESVEIQGFPINIIDTAGLRHTDHPIERLGIDRTKEWIDRADLVLFLIENNTEITEDDWIIADNLKGHQWMIVINKTDQPTRLNRGTLDKIADDHSVISISAQERTGFKELEEAIFQNLGLSGIEPDQEILVTRIRQKEALEKANQALERVIDGINTGLTDDLIAVELRVALQYLGELTGENADEQVINAIFANYCLGK